MVAEKVPRSLQRASDVERDFAVRVLCDAAADGRLSHDTLVERLDGVLSARCFGDIQEFLQDLPRPPLRTVHIRAVADVRQRIRRALPRGGGLTRGVLPLPDTAHPRLVIGRSRDCDVVLGDASVSRRHGCICRFGDVHFLYDLGSTNGTRVNGRIVEAPIALSTGDMVAFGLSVLRVTPPPTVPAAVASA